MQLKLGKAEITNKKVVIKILGDIRIFYAGYRTRVSFINLYCAHISTDHLFTVSHVQ